MTDAPPARPPHVLLADDSAVLLTAAGRALRDAGYTVTCTDSGADALLILAAKPPPDLVLLDVVMPGLDGYDVLAALGPTAPPVVLMTGAPVDAAHARQIGGGKVARVLTKPFDLTALLETVAAALAGPGAKPPPAGEGVPAPCPPAGEGGP